MLGKQNYNRISIFFIVIGLELYVDHSAQIFSGVGGGVRTISWREEEKEKLKKKEGEGGGGE